MKIINICLTAPYTQGLGYQENILTKYQSKIENNEVVIISSKRDDKDNKPSNEQKIAEYDGNVKIIRLNKGFTNKLTYIFRHYKGLYKALENERPDFIFVHGIQFADSLYIAKYLKKNKTAKCVVDNHADETNSAMSLPAKILHKTLWKYCAKRINTYVSTFYGVIPVRCDFIENIYGISKDKIDLLVMGGDDECVKEAKVNSLETRKKYKIKDDDFIIVTGGKIDKYKTDTIELMKAVNAIIDKRVKLLVFGSIDREIQKLFNDNLSTRVQYIGWIGQEEIYNLLTVANLCFFPGRHSVLWEQTVACGIPAIFKDIKNSKHVDIGGNCLFMKDSSEIPSLLEYVLQKDNYKQMYAAANSSKKDQFLYSNIARKSLEYATKD